MLVYYTNLIISTILNFFSRETIDKNKKVYRLFGFLGLLIPILVCGLRYNVGTDFKNYITWFMFYSDTNVNLSDKDYGFAFLIKILQLFTADPQILFIVSAIIINVLIMLFIKENTKMFDLGYFLFITLYFYFTSFNIMRQWIAISIFLFSLKFIYQKKLWKYLVCILIASTIHKTVLLTIPMYWILRIELKPKNISILAAVLIVVMSQFENVIVMIGNLLHMNLSKYLLYFGESDSFGSGGYAYGIMVLLVLIIVIITRKNYLEKIKYGKEQILLAIFACIVSFVGVKSMMFSRLQLYFIPVLIVTIPNLIELVPKRQKKVAYFIIIVLGMAYMYRSLSINGGEVLPYYSIFNYKG